VDFRPRVVTTVRAVHLWLTVLAPHFSLHFGQGISATTHLSTGAFAV
jgi:hypothetical protein